jgi:glycogenin glucosyltransferase
MRGFTLDFNAGMLFVRPNAEIFADMLKKIGKLKYDPWEAEQAFLNAYMRFSVWRLP